MKAAIAADKPGELVITLDAREIENTVHGRLSDKGLKAKLPSTAPGISAGILDMLAERPEPPGDPRPVRIVRVQLVRTVVIGESVIELGGSGREVYA